MYIYKDLAIHTQYIYMAYLLELFIEFCVMGSGLAYDAFGSVCCVCEICNQLLIQRYLKKRKLWFRAQRKKRLELKGGLRLTCAVDGVRTSWRYVSKRLQIQPPERCSKPCWVIFWPIKKPRRVFRIWITFTWITRFKSIYNFHPTFKW